MLEKSRFENILKEYASIKPILVLGDVGVDKYTFGEVTRISPEAPVPILEVTKEWYKLGLGANVTDNLRGLKVNSTLCGVIGDDKNGNLFESLLEDVGLKTWGIVREKKRFTTLKERVLTRAQQICRVDYESQEPLSDSSEKKILKRAQEFFKDHSAIILQDYGKGTLTKNLGQDIIAKAKEQNLFIAVDPSRRSDPMKYKGAHLLKPNQAEAKVLGEKLGHHSEDIESLIYTLAEKLDIEKVLVTLGSEGMAMLDTKGKGKVETIPTLATNVFDVSGAGDTAISTITASLVAGASLEEAVWLGNCASGVVVGKWGTDLVTQDELRDFYQQLQKKLSAER